MLTMNKRKNLPKNNLKKCVSNDDMVTSAYLFVVKTTMIAWESSQLSEGIQLIYLLNLLQIIQCVMAVWIESRYRFLFIYCACSKMYG